jgi:pimeloyl-ACP methyl ester carboxylesterase
VWSDADGALGRDAAEATGSFVEGPYRFEVLPGISHWVPEEAPEALNRLILDHLTQG